MNDEELLATIQQMFSSGSRFDPKLRTLAGRIRDGTDYEDANEYAARLGELLSRVLTKNMAGTTPISEETARAILTPMLTLDHAMVSEVVNTVQQNMNKAIGVGLKPQIPALDTNRIEGIIKKVSSYETADEAMWVLKEPVVNFSQAVVDQAVRDNATVFRKVGGSPKIIRKTEAHAVITKKHTVYSKKGKPYTYMRTYEEPCKWCESLAGVYEYDDVKGAGNNVYRRHASCRCTVTFADGEFRQNVWKHKETWTEKDAEEQRRAVANTEAQTKREAEEKLESTKYIRQYKEANNFKEAKQYANDVLGLEYSGLDKCNINALNMINKEITRIYDTFGDLKKNNVLETLHYYPKKARFVGAYQSSMNMLMLREVKTKNAIVEMAKAASFNGDMGFWSSTDKEAVIRHELGHAVQKLYYKDNPQIQAQISAMRERAMEQCGITDTTWSPEGGTREEMQKASAILSYYGLMNDGEFIAESVASYMSSNPKQAAIEVVNILLGGGKK